MFVVKIRITNFVQFHNNTIQCSHPPWPVIYLRSSKESLFKQFAFVLNFLYSEGKSVNFKDGLTGNWESEKIIKFPPLASAVTVSVNFGLISHWPSGSAADFISPRETRELSV